MNIKALNTIEIRVVADTAVLAASEFQVHLTRLQLIPGCLAYALSPSPVEPGLWILCGYWASSEQMTRHFDGQEMALLVSSLIEVGAQLSFAMFAPVLAE